MSLVIIGGGIIGLSTAYYASQSGQKVIIIDSASQLLLSASGFSGGFLARDWFAPDVLPLAELSFRLHRELAEAHDGATKWGYRASRSFSLVNQNGTTVRGEDWLRQGSSRANASKQTLQSNRAPPSISWMDLPSGMNLESISEDGDCAQVDPRALCEWLIQQCERNGVKIHLSTKPTRLVSKNDGGAGDRFSALECVDGQGNTVIIPCADIVIAAGAWTPRVFQTLLHRALSPDITSLAGHSVVLHSPVYTAPTEGVHAVFCSPGEHWSFAPELFSRVDGDKNGAEIFVGGKNSATMPLPESADHVASHRDEKQSREIRETALRILAGTAEVVRESLCFRPISSSGKPIVTAVEGVRSQDGRLYVASGHGPWGISMSLGTGYTVADMIKKRRVKTSRI
ncbi:hypothetical protein ASPZODRAFT_76540 [Penicilliopsis zonata CBS 506.65]|uniref:FAD dependent oxidoreductase domain-containing protein n=1 Tax=Penicilliopsis zonata CBS 506.65 TaxID=1073090 RepID=A0A1L9S611_9EURO|nr:hypothetical protein ASPZODRAFT_76540 [Penicilliopsis zonata CBS 506.65]OJJ42560.1 hypothetical protein ASPZODRAFT_76540 [Penicilliopsis zonata CBS 506.65]